MFTDQSQKIGQTTGTIYIIISILYETIKNKLKNLPKLNLFRGQNTEVNSGKSKTQIQKYPK